MTLVQSVVSRLEFVVSAVVPRPHFGEAHTGFHSRFGRQQNIGRIVFVSKQRSASETAESGQIIQLRDPGFSALLAWLIPGLGHLYQRRTAKGILFSISILSIFFYGLFLGRGRVVYAAWGPQEIRWHYFSQVGVGLPALPALVQYQLVKSGKEPFFPKSRFMVPPTTTGHDNELHQLHRHLNRYFELGSVYTVIAGLLNMLVIYDAWAGPAYAIRRRDDDEALDRHADEKLNVPSF